MALNVERCIGCHACSVACKVENEVPLGRFRTKVYYYDHGKFPKVKRNFLPTLCMQCEDTPCLKSCTNNAIEMGKDGIVRVLADKYWTEEVSGSNSFSQRSKRLIFRVPHYKSGSELAAAVAAAKK